jgi:Amt family ammonium transporter
LTAFIYPVVAHALWSTTGFLSPFHKDPVAGVGVIDAAGSGAIHLTGGVTALVATFVLGARQGRFHDEDGVLLENPQKIRGHSMALQLLGTFILWFGCKCHGSLEKHK